MYQHTCRRRSGLKSTPTSKCPRPEATVITSARASSETFSKPRNVKMPSGSTQLKSTTRARVRTQIPSAQHPRPGVIRPSKRIPLAWTSPFRKRRGVTRRLRRASRCLLRLPSNRNPRRRRLRSVSIRVLRTNLRSKDSNRKLHRHHRLSTSTLVLHTSPSSSLKSRKLRHHRRRSVSILELPSSHRLHSVRRRESRTLSRSSLTAGNSRLALSMWRRRSSSLKDLEARSLQHPLARRLCRSQTSTSRRHHSSLERPPLSLRSRLRRTSSTNCRRSLAMSRFRTSSSRRRDRRRLRSSGLRKLASRLAGRVRRKTVTAASCRAKIALRDNGLLLMTVMKYRNLLSLRHYHSLLAT